MNTLTIADYLKFANLQMAAEALYSYDAVTDGLNLVPGATRENVPLESANLTTGNLHSSKFAPDQVALSQLPDLWTVVEHKSNTATGFSGTLFRAINDDPASGIMKGELVLSFRSTEFVDDAARDNEKAQKGSESFDFKNRINSDPIGHLAKSRRWRDGASPMPATNDAQWKAVA